MPDSLPVKNETAIVGGGITGLYSALRALDSGQTDIHVYESSPARLGGKIKSTTLHNITFNMGAEFVDSDDDLMHQLCHRLGLKLIACADQYKNGFQAPNGQLYPNFYQEYAQVAEKIIHDRRTILAHPKGHLARSMDTLSLVDYIDSLRRDPQFEHVPSIVFDIAMNSFAAEVGQPAENITADQFIGETMRKAKKVGPNGSKLHFLVSDCGWRVEGGVERVITALHGYLAERGVHFHLSQTLESVTKQADGTTDLAFASPDGNHHVHSKKTFLALPAYSLAKVRGLETFGLAPDASGLIEKIQYANLVKFTLPIKPGNELPNVNLFSPGVQSYQPAPGYITFLCYNDGKSIPALIKHHLDQYALSMGKPAEDIFDASAGNIAFENPAELPCFSTPSPHHKVEIQALMQKMTDLSKQGLGVVGTYFPLKEAVGFMENGLNSVEQARARLYTVSGGQNLDWADAATLSKSKPSDNTGQATGPG